MRPHGGDLLQRVCTGDEALPFLLKDSPCSSAVLTAPFAGAFLLLLCPPQRQPPAALVPAHSQGRTEVKEWAALPCYPSLFPSLEWPHCLGLGAAQHSFENPRTRGP